MARKNPQSRARAEPEEITGLRAITRGGQTVYVPDDVDPRLLDEDSLNAENVIDAALSGVLSELGAADNESKVSVFKIANGKEAFLYECHPSGFAMSELQADYGAGEYRIKVYGKQQGTNYKIIHANPRITIGPTREQVRRAAEPAALAAPAAAPHAGTDPALAAILGQLVNEIKTLKASPAPSRKELLDELRAMSEMFKPAGGVQSGGVDELQRAVALAGAMRAAFGGGGEGAASDPESAPWNMMITALKEFAPIIRAKMGAADPGAAPASVTLPAPQREAAPIANEEIPEDDEMKIFLAAQMALLLIAARGQDNPQKWGERIYDDAPPEILRLIHGATWFEELTKIEPAFGAFRPWLEKVRAVIINEVEAVGGIDAATADPDAVPAPGPVLTGTDKTDTSVVSASGALPVVPGAAKT